MMTRNALRVKRIIKTTLLAVEFRNDSNDMKKIKIVGSDAYTILL